MKKKSEVHFIDENLRKAFDKLENGSAEEKQLYKWLSRAFVDIEENAFSGIQIPKKLMLKGYMKKYKIKNLWKYNLPNAWRLLYSIEGNDIKIISIILEWLDHKNYERRFKY